MAIAVQMRLKFDALVFHFSQLAQAPDLEAAGVGEDRARPAHKAVQPAENGDQFVARTQKQMVGVGENNPRIQFPEQVALRHGLDRGLRSDGHEYRGWHVSVRGFQHAGAGPGHRTDGL